MLQLDQTRTQHYKEQQLNSIVEAARKLPVTGRIFTIATHISPRNLTSSVGVNKDWISARCPYFAALFAASTDETIVVRSTYSTLLITTEYLKTGVIRGVDDASTALEVYDAAVVFGIEELAEYLAEWLVHNAKTSVHMREIYKLTKKAGGDSCELRAKLYKIVVGRIMEVLLKSYLYLHCNDCDLGYHFQSCEECEYTVIDMQNARVSLCSGHYQEYNHPHIKRSENNPPKTGLCTSATQLTIMGPDMMSILYSGDKIWEYITTLKITVV